MGTKGILFLLSQFFYQTIIAQHSKIYYYNQYFEPSDSVNAKFTGLLLQENQKWKFTVLNINDKNILMVGSYLDSAMKVKDGLLEFWYENKFKKNEEQYSNGKPNGWWKLWDEKGRLIDSSLYSNGELKLKTASSFYLNDSVSMHLFRDITTKRTYARYYYDSGGLMYEVEFLKGIEIERKNYYKNGQIKNHFKKDEKGKSIFVKRFTESGDELSEKEYQQQQKELRKQLEKEFENFKEAVVKNAPEFDGGKIGFQTYLNQNLKIPERVLRENIYFDVITIKFHLNQDGKAINIIIDGVNDAELKDVIQRFFEGIPRWDMKGHKTYGPLTYKIKLLH